jgi:hypothetical protein
VLPGLLLLMISPACVSKREINAAIWLNNTPIPQDICDRQIELWSYGFYRKLNNGKIEFVSFCKKEAREWLAMNKVDFNKFMDQVTVPNEPKRKGEINKERIFGEITESVVPSTDQR